MNVSTITTYATCRFILQRQDFLCFCVRREQHAPLFVKYKIRKNWFCDILSAFWSKKTALEKNMYFLLGIIANAVYL